ncbi:zinc ribbon domain-containing protein [Zavarzinella formosa]|uniref:hypothetical protein n=1 Tax=Zavarzinella formosa TaxID=360055 RepID=UPI0002E2426F|nr:hypothetical protein [Zavarzinella formosa]
MVVRIRCPHCQSVFSSKKPIPMAKRVPCLKCGQSLMTPATSMWVEESEPAADRSRPLPVAQLLPDEKDSAATLLPPSRNAGEPRPMGYVPPVARRRKWLPLLSIAIGLIGLTVGAFFVVRAVKHVDLDYELGLSTPSQQNDLLLWAPADTDAVMGADMTALASNNFIESIVAKENNSDYRDAGFDLGDVETIVAAIRQEADDKITPLLVMRLKTLYDPNPAIRSGKAKVQKSGSIKYMSLNDRMWLYNPTDKIVLVSSNQQFLLDAIQRKSANIRFSQELLKSVKSTTGPFWVAAVGPAAQPESPWDFHQPLEFGRPAEPYPLVKAARLSTKVSANSIEMTCEGDFSTPEKAKLASELDQTCRDKFMREKLSKRNARDPETYLLRIIFDSYATGIDGSKLISTFSIPTAELERFARRIRRGL